MNNPNFLDHMPGTGGSGVPAIVVAGSIGFEISTDTAGSIRWPCHLFGLVGIQPMPNRTLPAIHAIPPTRLPSQPTEVGLIVSKVERILEIFIIISGSDNHAPMLASVPLRNPTLFNLNKLWNTFHTYNGVMRPISEITTKFKESITNLHQPGNNLDDEVPIGVGQSIEMLLALMSGWDGSDWPSPDPVVIH
jgi:Asp-tRNA(Asn)/Glu-tRNA(Gln) amidotransferase A subunit family amidase